MNLVFIFLSWGIFIITLLFRGALSLPFVCPPVATHRYLLPSCGCFGRLCWLHCSSARLLRLYFCVVVVSVTFVGCTVLPHASPFIILRRGCFGRLCWLNCPSARFSHWHFVLWLFRSPLLVALFFHTLFPFYSCVVVVSVAFAGCTVLPHAPPVVLHRSSVF